jgi:uncharacterized protein with FMN-binding domain
MRRTPIVIGATIAGLAGVLAFHTRPAQLSLPTVPAAGATPRPASGASSSGTAQGPGGASPTPARTAPQAGHAARSATGPGVNYSYGVMSVRITVSGRRILKVGIGSLDDGGNPRSESIDQQAIPILEREVLQAQSASIQGVSGASFTSTGFEQSLQGALHALGFQ